MNLSANIKRWLPVAAVVWIFFVLSLFYWVQKPLGLANAVALARTIIDLCAAIFIGVAGLALGSRLLHALQLPGLFPVDRLILGGGLGLGLLSLTTFGLGLLGLLSRWLFLGLLFVLIILLRREAIDAIRLFRRIPIPYLGSAIYIGTTLLLALLAALMPPTDWDGLFYHLTGPSWILETGRIGAPPAQVPHLSFPGLMESLFLLAMAIRGDVTAKLLHWFFAVLLGGLTYRLTERHIGVGLGWRGVVVLYATPMVAVLAGWAYNDLALAFFQVAALYALLNGFEQSGSQGEGRWFIVSGALSGLAMGVKYTSFICPVTLIGIIVWHTPHSSKISTKRLMNRVFTFCAAALLLASPWYLRNLAFTGNPVYPFAYSIFGGAGWSRWRAEWYAQAGTGLGGQIWQLLLLPVMLTLGLWDVNYFDGRTGPLFLLALPLLLFVLFFDRRKRPAWGHLFTFFLAQYVFWGVGVSSSRSLFQSRLLLSAIVALCPLLSYLFHRTLIRFEYRGFSLQRFVRLVLGMVLSFNIVHQALDTIRLRPLPYIVGVESREVFLTRRLGGYYLAMQAVRDLSSDAHVQFLWEPRSYYSQRIVQPDSILETWAYLCDLYQRDVDAIADDLQSQGITHILLHTAGMHLVAREQPDHLPPKDLDVLEDLRIRYLDVVWELPEAYVLYAWR